MLVIKPPADSEERGRIGMSELARKLKSLYQSCLNNVEFDVTPAVQRIRGDSNTKV